MFDAVDVGDVRMIQCRQRLRLSLKEGQPLRVANGALRKDFQSDIAIQRRIPGAIHLAHSASSEQRVNFVWADASARLKHGGLWRIIVPRPRCRSARPPWAILDFANSLGAWFEAIGLDIGVGTVNPASTRTDLAAGNRPIFAEAVDAGGNPTTPGSPLALFLPVIREAIENAQPPQVVARAFRKMLELSSPTLMCLR